MSAVLRLAWREVRERQVLLWAALGFALPMFLLQVLPRTNGAHGFEDLTALLLLLLLAFTRSEARQRRDLLWAALGFGLLALLLELLPVTSEAHVAGELVGVLLFFAIARRGVRERQVLLLEALGCALLGLMLQFLPGDDRGPWRALAMLLYFGYPPAAAVAAGSSLLGRDLALGRLSFYFSRPLSAGTLWAGKFLGGIALVVGSFLCCYAPLLLSGNGPDPRAAAVMLLGWVCLMAMAHAITAMYRAGSRLFGLDLTLGALCLIGFGAVVRRLVSAGAGRALLGSSPMEGAAPLALVLTTLVVLGAGAVQLHHGRGDAQRGHVGLSGTIWPFALAAFIASALWGRWVLGVTLADLRGPRQPLFASPRGSAVFLTGLWPYGGRAGFSPIFLVDGESGSYLRLPPESVTQPAFSGNGKVVAWAVPEAPWWAFVNSISSEALTWGGVFDPMAQPGAGPNTLAVARLDRSQPAMERRSIGLPVGVSRAVALDTDGRRVLVSSSTSAHLLETSTGRLLASVPVSDVVAADILPGGTVRFYRKEENRLQEQRFHGELRGAAIVVLDWSPTDGSRVERVRIAGDFRMSLVARRGALCVVSIGRSGRAILDADSGSVRTFEDGIEDASDSALVLSTGHVALAIQDGVRIVSRDGTTVVEVPLWKDGPWSYYGPHATLRERGPGSLAVSRGDAGLTEFVDVASGALTGEERGLMAAGPRGGGMEPAEPGALASRLFMDKDGALIALEADGRRRVIVAGHTW